MIDLHIHSRYSDDGQFTPSELVTQCAKAGISLMAICDHNTASGVQKARQAAKAQGISCLSGMEIDCTLQGTDFHVLGYGIHPDSAFSKEIEANVRSQSQAASYHMLEKTKALGFQVEEADMERLAKDSYWPESWTGEMFAEFLLSQPEYAAHPLLLPYRPGGSRSDNPYVNFYWDFYAQGKPCYAPFSYPAMETVLDGIHQNGGLAVLAHPQINLKGNLPLLEEILTLPLDGLEAFSSYHTPSQAAFFLETARAHGLLVTCGSDYHGKTKPAISLGGHGCTLTEEEQNRQLKRLLELAAAPV